MASLWEMLGERVGYGLAVVVLGPAAAIERRSRRAMRAAMLGSLADLRPLRLQGQRGTLRRSVQLPAGAGATPMEVDLDLHAHIAKLTLRLERLPSYVEGRISKKSGPLHFETTTLDDEAAKAFVAMLGAGAFSRLAWTELALSPELLVIVIPAPTAPEGWPAIREGLVEIVSWLVARWPASYR